jgi:hypothetical protein
LSTYNEFSIQEVIPDLSNKRLIIITNFKVDPQTILPTNIALYNYDRTSLETYQLIPDNKNIFVVMNDYPTSDTRYYLKIKDLRDALGRTLKTEFNDYIIFKNEVKTKLEIVSPKSRETVKSRVIPMKIKVTELDEEKATTCRIEFSSDNIFYNILNTVEQDIVNGEVSIDTTIEREGQIYVRARAERDNLVGDWSETICFNIYTIPMESINTNFLEDYLLTDDLFDDTVELIQTEIQDKTAIATNDGVFYLEFNKEIQLPENYEVDEDGYVNLGTIMGFRKELK